MKMSRRDFMKAMAVASSGFLPMLPTGCGERADDSSPSVSTVRKTLHADLSHLAHWPATHRENVVLRVGGRTHGLAVHTADTHERFFPGVLRGASRLTHFAEEVKFSALGPQSYVVGVPNERGFVTPLLTGIHLPRRAASLASPETDPDPHEITDTKTAATWSVYHNPQILTLDTDVATRVVDHITQTASFDSIVKAIQKAGQALTPEEAGNGFAGWLVGEYVLDGKGEKIQKTKLDGTPVTNDKGEHVFVYRWVPDKDVEATTNVVVAQTLERFHNDETLEGVKYLTRRGSERFDFVFPDQGRERGRRSFKVERKSDDSFDLTVTNPNSLGTLVGMRAFYATGKRIDSGTMSGDFLIGYVPGTSYTSIETVFQGASSGVFSVTIPVGAAKIDLLSAAIAFSIR